MPDPPPSADALLALDADDWSALLAVALPVLRELPDRHVDATVRRLASVPPSRLVSGRSRQDLARVLVREPVWSALEQALGDDTDRPWEDGAPTAPPVDGDELHRVRAEVARLEQQVDHLRDRERTLAERLGAAREELTAAERGRDGAEARARTAAGQRDEAVAELEELTAELEAARQELGSLDARVEREVDRARRRDDAEVRGLREDLRAVRRERDELRRERDGLQRERDELREEVVRRRHAHPDAPEDDGDDDGRGRRGRPSTLPEGMVAGTRDAAAWLVAGGRELLVDGYNVTRTHHGELPYPEQRRWLEQAVAALARRRQVEATVVWDSTIGRPSTDRHPSGLTVRYTEPDATADDELVLHVQLAIDPDTPVVAVTDDVELRGRLAQHGVDLLDSTSFTWLL